MLTGKELGNAIKAAIEAKGVTQKSVAAFFGVKPPSVSDWIKRGTISKEKLPRLWGYFSDVVGPEHWGLRAWPMVTVEADSEMSVRDAIELLHSSEESRYSNISAGDANTSPGPVTTKFVPLLTSIQAGQWADIARSFQMEDAIDWLPCPTSHGNRTFCLVVEGESMRNPGSKPSYDPGDVIFVDPDRCERPGDRVVVVLEGQEKATFKQYMEEDGRKFLKALNPDWKPRYIEINGNASIRGVVIGKWVPE